MGRERVPEIVNTTEKILKMAKVPYQILEEEKCCGSILLRTGFFEEAREQMTKNIGLLSGSKLLISCAGCYRTFKMDYPRLFDVEMDVIHTSEFFLKLIKAGKIKVKRGNLKITYHDPCHLSRHCGEYEAPRRVISAIGVLKEMRNHADKSNCCGAGGGVKSAYPKISDKIADRRVDEALQTGAKILSTTCPFCKFNLQGKGIKVMDLSEIILMGMGGVQ